MTTADRYPSRKVDRPQVIGRREPVVHGSAEDGPLSQQQLDDFDRDGLLQVPGVFSTDEIHALRDELERLTQDSAVRNAEETITDLDTGDVRSVFSVQHHSDLIGRSSATTTLPGSPVRFSGPTCTCTTPASTTSPASG